MEEHRYLKPGDRRIPGDVVRHRDGPQGVWHDVRNHDIITEYELRTYIYFRPNQEWRRLHMTHETQT